MADENKPKVTGKRTVKYKQIAEDLAKQNKEALANTRLGKRKQAERIAKQEAEEIEGICYDDVPDDYGKPSINSNGEFEL